MVQETRDQPVQGLFWMAITGLLFVGVTAVVKHLGDDVPPAQAAFLRYVLGLVFLLPLIGRLVRVRLDRRQVGLFALRGAAHTGAVILWFFAMTQIPIAEVTAMNYLSPVYVTLGAALFLGERLRTRRILAVIVALIGAVIILRPGLREIEMGHIAMLFTAVFFAGGYLIAKQLSSEVEPSMIVAMLSITVTIGLAPFAWAVWVPVDGTALAWLFLVACLATAGHTTMTIAFASAPVSVTQPVTFLQLIWATLLGAFVFNEGLDVWVLIGGGIIMASVSVLAWREALARGREAAVAAPLPR
ncbi:DMT family transporter [Aestuariibius insulae]|uniref:DMT family transporter n=1 Tax=Aestuariibius insulae TaxID=2058287 RepID=UPI00345E81E6